MEPQLVFDFSGVLVVFGVAGVLLLVGLGLRHLQQKLLKVGIGQATDSIEVIIRLLNDPSPHDLAVVPGDAWPPEALALMRVPLDAARELGFTVLADVEDRSVTRATGARALMRGLVHDDGVTMLTVMARPGPDGRLVLAFECSSEVSSEQSARLSSEQASGIFVETVASDTPLLDAGPDVRLEQVPSSTPVATLLERHRARVQALTGDAAVVNRIGDVDAAIQRSHRRLVATATARARIPGGITREELGRLGTDSEPEIVDKVFAELQRRAASRRR